MTAREQQPIPQDPFSDSNGTPSHFTISPNGEVILEIPIDPNEKVIRGLAQPDEDLLLGIALVSKVRTTQGTTRVYLDQRYPHIQTALKQLLDIYGGEVDSERNRIVLKGKGFPLMAHASRRLQQVPTVQGRVDCVFTGLLVARPGYNSITFEDAATANRAIRLFNTTHPLTLMPLPGKDHIIYMNHPGKLVNAVVATATVRECLPDQVVYRLKQTASPAYYQRLR